VNPAEGSTRTTASARSSGAAGVHSSGHVSIGAPQEPGRAPHLLRCRRRGTGRQGRPEMSGTGGRAVLRPHSTGEGREPQSPRKGGGHDIHWREGANRPTYRLRDTSRDPELGESMSTKLNRIAELVQEDPERQFFSIAHLLTPGSLYRAFKSLRKDASAGVDGVTYAEYAKDAEDLRQLRCARECSPGLSCPPQSWRDVWRVEAGAETAPASQTSLP
jgi:hypothetical protein